MILVGIDEAGYGPTLGPLVVSAAVFRLTDEGVRETPCGPDLWSILRESVTRKRDRSRIAVNDSKKIYRPGKGLGRLEEGIFPFLHCCLDDVPANLRELLRYLCRSARADAYLDAYPWYHRQNVDVPTNTFANYTRALGNRLAADLRRNEIEFLGLASAPVDVIAFNRALAESDNKALIPFAAIGALLLRLWRAFPAEAMDVIVDRQGGRINYARLLYRFINPRSIVVESQSEELSTYQLLGDSMAMRVTFTRQGDSKSFAVALASMASKYLRELHMGLFNGFWYSHCSALRPTAGYPLDARRFLGQIAALRRQLGVPDETLIRQR